MQTDRARLQEASFVMAGSIFNEDSCIDQCLLGPVQWSVGSCWILVVV